MNRIRSMGRRVVHLGRVARCEGVRREHVESQPGESERLRDQPAEQRRGAPGAPGRITPQAGVRPTGSRGSPPRTRGSRRPASGAGSSRRTCRPQRSRPRRSPEAARHEPEHGARGGPDGPIEAYCEADQGQAQDDQACIQDPGVVADPEVADGLVDRPVSGPEQTGRGKGHDKEHGPDEPAEGEPAIERGRSRCRPPVQFSGP